MDDLLPDLCDVYPDDVQWLPMQWQSYGATKIFSGEIVTLRCYHDNSYVKKWVNEPGNGRVLFVDGSGATQRALLGDMLAEKALENGWAGIVINGVIRDAGAIGKMAIGVMALGTCPIKTEKRDKGEEQIALRVHEIAVSPGNYLYADLNGVVISQTALDLSAL
ncbi:putative 4-hydroxy-4-methyl-2-oxoglutarate aldolase [Thaumasiovibrio subtropicus]|uniref:putative 4-hydroxy-4-methyl-2-oxoglutarate aldolase n=1 Tax=Thaumasiovibrio subtropicus TaxID=1891207 RepID=UPI000B34FD67|nr:putative 4-hydroxy-4-methyl-2-oxoglutarate aldolase [Thaumasiovibrio subtropicus]